MSDRTYFDAHDLIDLGRVCAVAVHPDGGWLAVAVERLDDDGARYVSDLWRVPLDGSEPHALTRGDASDRAPAFAHDGALLFLSNRPTKDDPEGKHTQIHRFSPFGGEPEAITNEPLGVGAFRAARGADALVWTTQWEPGVEASEQRDFAAKRAKGGPSARVYTKMPVRFWDHWLPTTRAHVIVMRDGARHDLTPDADREHWQTSLSISDDGATVAFNLRIPCDADRLHDSHVVVVDLETMERTVLGTDPRVSYGGCMLDTRGGRVIVTRHVRDGAHFGKNQLGAVAVATGEFTPLAPEHDGWLSALDLSPDGETLLASGDWRAAGPLWLVDMESGELARLTSEPSGGTHHAGAFYTSGGELRVAGSRSSIMHPAEPFTCAARPGAEPELVANLSGWATPDWIAIEEHHSTSTDGAPVQFRVVRPTHTDAQLPVLMWIHGGPVGAWGDVWHWRWNPLVAAASGYAIVLPNPRGSTGFGQEFVEGIWGNVWGAQCYEDLMTITDDLQEFDYTQSDAMVAMGGSFGGYMTNWIGTQTDRFSCLVTHAGLTDLRAFHGVTDNPAWWALFYGIERPFTNSEQFDKYSPIRFIRNWKSPTLIIHGERDYRVPVGEALILFEALQSHGVESELLAFPDENHWILKPRNIVSWYDHALEFIGRHAPGRATKRDEDEGET